MSLKKYTRAVRARLFYFYLKEQAHFRSESIGGFLHIQYDTQINCLTGAIIVKYVLR